jgi:predicted dehydrogenase
MGLVAGNGIKAYYAFEGGVAAEFESYQGDGIESPYRIDIHGTAGTISVPGPIKNEPDINFHPHTNPRLFNDDRWEVIPAEPPPNDHKWVNAHHRMARSMMDMLVGQTPEYELAQGPNARLYLEMAMATHASHIAGTRVSLPLPDGKNPFDSWTS